MPLLTLDDLWMLLVGFVLVLLAAILLVKVARRAHELRAAELGSDVSLSNENICRSYSIYVDGMKIGTCLSSSILMRENGTVLRCEQVMPMKARHYGRLFSAFSRGEPVKVYVGIIDDSMLQLGQMSVRSLIVKTDNRRGVTKLTATLHGDSLRAERGSLLATVNGEVSPESLRSVFAGIEARARRISDEFTASLNKN